MSFKDKPDSHRCKFRLAPTPSGYLHAGNIFNFTINYLAAFQTQGNLLLRIDDLDQDRSRIGYLEDIFQTLEFLGFSYQEGPTSAKEFQDRFSQGKFISQYLELVQALLECGSLYHCNCSRKDLLSKPCNCVKEPAKSLAQYPLRLLPQSSSEFNNQTAPIILKRDGMPAYHIACLYHDVNDEITHIIRGEDLFESTNIQRSIAKKIPTLNRFLGINFKFHPLLLNPEGGKISKSVQGQNKENRIIQTYKTPEVFWQKYSQQWFGLKFNSLTEAKHCLENQLIDLNKICFTFIST